MKGAEKFTQLVWLLNTIHQANTISLAGINERWVKTEMSGGVEMSRHTCIRYKCAIEETFDVIIDCDRKTNCYSIKNPQVLRDDSIQRWLLSTITVSNIISESLSLQDRILLENIQVESKQLETIINAMKRKRRITFLYTKYDNQKPTQRIVTPCCIKLFKQRWYVIDYEPSRATGPFKPFAFDRISKLSITDQTFTLPDNFNAQSIFTDSFGIFIGDVEEAAPIVIRAYGNERYYIRDLPLHHSQEVLSEGPNYTDYRFYIRPSTDFIAELLSKGNRIEVLSPDSFRNRIKEEHLNAAGLYENRGEG